MLRSKVLKYFNKSTYDLNCAEVMLYATNEEYQMNLSNDALKSMAAFGGGMAIENVCGAITGSLAVLGILFVRDRAHESDKIKTLSAEFIDKFNNALGSMMCKELKGKYRNNEIGCSVMVETAAVILEEMINREKGEL